MPSGMGDNTITLTRDETENYLKIEDALSFDCDRYECTPELSLIHIYETGMGREKGLP